jgi:polyphosphate kinase
VELPELRAELRRFLDIQLTDQRSAWEMQPDGSYIQRQGEEQNGSHEKLIRQAEKRLSDAQRLVKLKKRKLVKRKQVVLKK